MSGKMATVKSPLRTHRIDPKDLAPGDRPWVLWAAWAALASAFVLIGVANLDLGPIESRLGLAAGSGVGPLGRVYGSWEPGLWPVPVALGATWARFEGGFPTANAVRWPSAIAGIGLGLILSRRLAGALGPRAGVWMGLCWFGSLALIDRSAGAGLDLVAALGAIGALDRLLGRGADWVAGLWAALAFLSAGWPPLALIALAIVVVGRPGAWLSLKLAVPPLVAVIGWSAWTLAVARSDAWGAALALPLTMRPDWTLALGLLAFSLPWSPIAALAASRSVRETWPEAGRTLVVGWLQVSGVCLLAGTIIPGLADSARLPALAGLAVAAAAVCDRAWAGALPTGPRRSVLAIALTIAALWAAVAMLQGGYLIASIAFYRSVAIAVILMGAAAVGLAIAATRLGDGRWALGALVVVAVGLKVAHGGYYISEWNYRCSKGPWGRAIGQWVPHTSPIYTTLPWPHDLAFAIGRPIRQLPDARVLGFKDLSRPQFVLLQASEFAHWPEEAPKLIEVRAFQDEHGGHRVLARTGGPLTLLRRAGD